MVIGPRLLWEKPLGLLREPGASLREPEASLREPANGDWFSLNPPPAWPPPRPPWPRLRWACARCQPGVV